MKRPHANHVLCLYTFTVTNPTRLYNPLIIFCFLQDVAPLIVLTVHNGECRNYFPLAYKEKLPVHTSSLASMLKQRTSQAIFTEYIEWVNDLKEHFQDY